MALERAALGQYGKNNIKVTSMFWVLSVLFALPSAALMVLLIPDATADQIAVVIASPLATFFILGHIAFLLPAPPPAREQAPGTVRLAAIGILVIIIVGPSSIAYHLLDIGWAARPGALLCAGIAATVTCVFIARRLMGGGRPVFSKLAVVYATALMMAATGAVHLGSAWTSMTRFGFVHQRVAG